MKKIKENKLYILTISLSLLIIVSIMYYKKLFPFGNNSLAYSDFIAQYRMFINEVITKIDAGESLFISLNSGYGYSLFATIAYYLLSPLNILFYILKNFDINKVLNIVILIKPLLASITMTIFLKNKFNSDKFYVSLLAILYAFSGFINAYYFNIMWLDSMILLPLITLGLEHLVVTKKTDLYIISLFLAIIFNYYEGYVLCIYSLIYFIAYSLYKNSFNKETIIRFIKCSCISLLLSSFILLPLYFELKDVSTNIGSSLSNNYSFNILDFISSFLTGTRATRYSSVARDASDLWTNTPNIKVGLFTLIMFISYIFNKNMKKHNKIVYLSILLVYLLCFFIPLFDFIQSGFRIPNDMPFRYSYIFSFILVIITMYSIKYIDRKSLYYSISITGIILLILLVFTPLNATKEIILINMFIAIFYAIFYMVIDNKKLRKISIILISLLVVGECFINFTSDLRVNDIKKIKEEDNYELENNVKYIKSKDTYPFYRIEHSNSTVANSSGLYNYNNISIFNSVTSSASIHLNDRLGLDNNGINYFDYRGYTPVYNVISDVKYLIGEPDEYFEEVIYKVYKNKYNKDLMFEVDKDILNWEYENDDPFIVQNDLVYRISKIENLFTKKSFTSVNKINDKYYEYTIDTDSKYVYLIVDNMNIVSFGETLYYRETGINNKTNPLNIAKKLGIKYDKKMDIVNSRIVKLDVSNNKTIRVYYKDGYSDFNMYTMDNDKFLKFQSTIDNSVSLLGLYNDEILGTIEIEKDDSFIFTSIEYKDGWKVYIDSKEVQKEKIGGALLGFHIDKGTHAIYMKYELPYYNEGIIITSITIIFITLYKLMDTISDKDYIEEDKEDGEI